MSPLLIFVASLSYGAKILSLRSKLLSGLKRTTTLLLPLCWLTGLLVKLFVLVRLVRKRPVMGRPAAVALSDWAEQLASLQKKPSKISGSKPEIATTSKEEK